jgi:hypothetical protein
MLMNDEKVVVATEEQVLAQFSTVELEERLEFWKCPSITPGSSCEIDF